MNLINPIEHSVKPLARWAAVFTTIGVFGAIGWFLYTNVWIPHAGVTTADYEKGIAEVYFSNIIGQAKHRTLYSGSTIGAGGGWGIRFTSDNPYSDDKPNRIELVKNDLTYKTLHIAASE